MILLFLACSTPEPTCPIWFSDLDGDGYGVGEGVASCEPLAGRVEQDGDCDDWDQATHPGAWDRPLDRVDQDCDGQDTCASTQLVRSMEEIALSGSTLSLPLLRSAELISLSNTSGTALIAPKLPWAGSIESGVHIELPALLQVDELNLKASASCPALVHAQIIRSTGPLFAPALLSAGSLRLDDSGNNLSGLRSVEALRTKDCAAFGALARVGQVHTSCELDLRSLTTFPGTLTYVSSGTESGLLLPDPFPGALWVDQGDFGTLNQDRIEGALSIQTWSKWGPEDFVVREVGGQLFLQLNDMTSLGTLSQVEVIEGDLRYCMPQVPDAEIQAWLSQVSVGGRVHNRCR